MKLNKFTWNNGTQSSPIVLTNDQIKKLIAIGQRTDIVSDVRGYVTTNSRKMQKFLKYALTQQFSNLNVICDEELADTFTLRTSINTIKEGSRELITISTDTGITHNFLKWKYEYSDFTIDGDISEDNINEIDKQIKSKLQYIIQYMIAGYENLNTNYITNMLKLYNILKDNDLEEAYYELIK